MKVFLPVLALILFFSVAAEAIPGLHRSIMNTPVLVATDSGSAGTGVYLSKNNNLYLMTAKHVLFDNFSSLRGNNVSLISYTGNEPVQQMIYNVDLRASKKANNIYVPSHRDVAIIKIASGTAGKPETADFILADGVSAVGDMISVVAANSDTGSLKFKDVKVSNDVFMLGYPLSLGMDAINNELIDAERPLLRKGIVAGKNDNNHTIIIDCPVYKGNSGGPVYEVDRDENGNVSWLLIGIVTDFIPLVERLKSSLYEYENINLTNSGYGVVEPLDDILKYLVR